MSSKQNYIDEVHYILKKHDFANHKAMIEIVLNDVYNQLMSEMSPMDADKFEFYTKNYSVDVALDGSWNMYASTLPVSVLPIRRPQGGVVAINSLYGTGFRLYPVSERNVRLTNNTEAGLYDRYYGYWVNRDKVYYTGYTADLAAANVRMSLAVQFKDFATTDEVPLPAGRNYEMIQLAVDFIRQTQIIDLQIDAND